MIQTRKVQKLNRFINDYRAYNFDVKDKSKWDELTKDLQDELNSKGYEQNFEECIE